jgi:MoxR-like ATPase
VTSAIGGHAETIARIRDHLCAVILGKAAEIELLLAGLLSGGHILLEDIPGVGKTPSPRPWPC